MVKWLDGIGFCDSPTRKVTEHIVSMEEDYIDYKIKDGTGIFSKKDLDKLRCDQDQWADLNKRMQDLWHEYDTGRTYILDEDNVRRLG